MDILQKTLLGIWHLVVFFVLSLIFLPAWLIVNHLQETWSKQLNELF